MNILVTQQIYFFFKYVLCLLSIKKFTMNLEMLIVIIKENSTLKSIY